MYCCPHHVPRETCIWSEDEERAKLTSSRGFMVPLIISHRGLIGQRPNRAAAVHHIRVIRKFMTECFILEVVDLKGFLNASEFHTNSSLSFIYSEFNRFSEGWAV